MEKYKNSELPIQERVDDLMERMTLEEKLSQLTSAYAYGGRINLQEIAEGIGHIGMSSGTLSVEQNVELVNSTQRYLVEETRLGIPAIFHVETLNGGSLAEATTYQIPLGLASSFDTEAVHEMAGRISAEMTASGQKMALAPVVDIARDPRWGRIGETYGESPTLTAAMGTAYARGIQGDSLAESMACCPKHFLGYAAGEGGINIAGAHMGPRELHEVHAKPFCAMIRDADIAAVMNCYLAVDGEPLVASRRYLTELLREQLGFHGTVVADYGSFDKLYEVFHMAKDPAEAGVMALYAGLDVETPSRKCMNKDLLYRLENGEVPMNLVEQALRRNLTLKFALGLFENPYVDPEKAKSVCQKPEAKDLAYRLVCESMVLLKNEKVLPLKNVKHIAVIGPNADDVRGLFGGYTYPAFYEGMYAMLTGIAKSMGLEGVTASNDQRSMLLKQVESMPDVYQLIRNNYPGVASVLEAIQEKTNISDSGITVSYAKGCDYMGHNRDGFEKAVALARESDVVLFVCGGKNGSSNGCTMGENVDNCFVGLPGIQEELAKELKKTGKPLVMVHMDGRPLSSVWASEHADAILEVWHPGQMGGQAIADVLFGDAAPSGKLAITDVRHEGQIPVYAEQNRGNGITGRGRTNSSIQLGYVEDSGYPLYAFGYGQTYTQFEITDIRLSSAEMAPDGSMRVSCQVTNIGDRKGTEVVQLYGSDLLASCVRPVKELCGFRRVELEPGEARTVEFEFYADQLAIWVEKEKWKVEAGEMELFVGNASDHSESAGVVLVTDSRTFDGKNRHMIAGTR